MTQDDIALATEAMNKLQGAVLPSSERGGIRIEYARTKMGDVVSRITRNPISSLGASDELTKALFHRESRSSCLVKLKNLTKRFRNGFQ